MPATRRHAILLLVPLFLSGFCGISYEVLYARLLSDVIGSQFTVSASILVTFLFGIGLGTRAAHRAAGSLWAIESLIGAYGVFFILLLPHLDRILYLSLFRDHASLQIAAVCLLLLVPSTCIGASLPLFSALLSPLFSSRVFGLAYTVYNFGAALTALAIEFVLIRRFGIRATLLGVAGLNFLVGAILLAGRRALRPAPEKPAVPYPRRAVAALVLVSLASAVFQLWMVKVTEFVYGPFNETFAMVLCIVLLGIALGALASRVRGAGFGVFVAGSLLAMLALLGLFQPILFYYARHQSEWRGAGLILFRLLILLALMGPGAVCFGAAIPALMKTESNVAEESGRLLSLSSFANAAGFLLMALVVHQTLGYGQSLVFMTVLVAAAFAVHLSVRARLRAAAAATAAVVIAASLCARVWNENLLYGSYTDFGSLGQLRRKLSRVVDSQRFRRRDEVLAVNSADGTRSFNLNGYESISVAHVSEHLVGLMSALVSPHLDTALVLGLGTGSTAGTVAEYFGHTDVIEISRLVIDHQEPFRANSFDVARRPNVSLYCDDAVRFLKSNRKRYDIVLNTVTNPQYFSSSKLYTTDFMRSAKTALAEGGVYTTWVSTSIGNNGVGIIVRTLKENFNHCWIGAIRSGYWLLLCSDTPLALHQEGTIERNPEVRRYFAEHGRSIDGIRYSMVSDDAFGLLNATGGTTDNTLANTLANTLDRPTLEFEIARLSLISGQSSELIRTYIRDNYSTARLDRTIFTKRPLDPMELLFYFWLVDRSGWLTEAFLAMVQQSIPEARSQLDDRRLDTYRHWAREWPCANTFANLGFELRSRGNCDEAIDLLKQTLALDPHRNEANLEIGLCLQKQKQWAQAADYFQRELAIDPQDHDAQEHLKVVRAAQ